MFAPWAISIGVFVLLLAGATLMTWIKVWIDRRKENVEKYAVAKQLPDLSRKGGLWAQVAFLYGRISYLERHLAEAEKELFNNKLERRRNRAVIEALLIHGQQLELMLGAERKVNGNQRPEGEQTVVELLRAVNSREDAIDQREWAERVRQQKEHPQE